MEHSVLNMYIINLTYTPCNKNMFFCRMEKATECVEAMDLGESEQGRTCEWSSHGQQDGGEQHEGWQRSGWWWWRRGGRPRDCVTEWLSLNIWHVLWKNMKIWIWMSSLLIFMECCLRIISEYYCICSFASRTLFHLSIQIIANVVVGNFFSNLWNCVPLSPSFFLLNS